MEEQFISSIEGLKLEITIEAARVLKENVSYVTLAHLYSSLASIYSHFWRQDTVLNGLLV